MLLVQFREAVEQGVESTFWQELFHITTSEEAKLIKPHMIQVRDDFSLEFKKIDGLSRPFIKIDDEYRLVSVGIGIDSAISYKVDADDTAIVMIAKDRKERIYVLDVLSGKFGVTDEYKLGMDKKYINELCMDYADIERIGTVNEVLRWIKKRMPDDYRPQVIVETNLVGSQVVRTMKTLMTTYGLRFFIKEVYQDSNKIERILDTLQPYYQSMSVYHRTGQEKLARQLEYIKVTKHDDEADALALVVAHLRKPVADVVYDADKKDDIDIKKLLKNPFNIKVINSKLDKKELERWRII